MIIKLYDLIESKGFDNVLFIEYIKNQMITIYDQLSYCKELNNEDFLDIVKNQIIFISIDDSLNVQGCVTLIIERKMIHNGKYVGHVEDVVVDEIYRSLKIGKQLMKHVIQYAKDKQCYKVILNCNNNVEGFYTKLGFHSKNKEMSLYFD
tara:strand:- start:61 stop:510 length:450 start_codon:yes stop_codon:yes gene_type:complete